MARGTLFVVATPIGNLDDLSSRAAGVLASVALVAAEDTRVTGRLLSHFDINTALTSVHEHNESTKIPDLIETLNSGKSVALVSDAGTPLISDPGYRLVRAAHEAGIVVLPVPGPSAVLAALSASGLPTDRFSFEGFPASKRAARAKELNALAKETRTMVFFESVHRIGDTLADMVDAFGQARPAAIGRELTKRHEQMVSASLGELRAMIDDGTVPSKGEFVIVVGGADGQDDDSAGADAEALLRELVAVLPGRQAVEITARLSGVSRNALYERMLALKPGKD